MENKREEDIESELVKIYNELFKYAYSLTSDYAKAEDLVQDTVVTILGNQDKYIYDVNFKGWAYTIIKNKYLNNRLRELRIYSLIDDNNEPYYLELPNESGFDTPDGSYTINEFKSILRDLPHEYYKTFILHIAGYKYHEIADKLRIPLGSVKSRIFFARNRLRILLKDYRK